MNDQQKLLRQGTFLGTLTTEEIKEYLADNSFRIASYGRHEIVHFPGEACRKLEVILEGRVVVERIDPSGNLLTLAEFIADELLGGNLLFSRNPYYPMTVTTRQPTVIVEITKERLFTIFTKNHRFLRIYLELIADHSSLLGDRIKRYLNRTIRESVLSYLEYESKRQHSRKIALPMSKKALAEKFGVQRTSLSRELAKMQKDGLIHYDAESITILGDQGKVDNV